MPGPCAFARQMAFLILVLTFSFCLPVATMAQTTSADRPKIGLALSGGGARGAAHIGVLRILEREQIPIDYVAGTSMGSIVGGMYASGMPVDEIESQLIAVDWDNLFDDRIDRKDRTFRRKTDDRLWLIDRKPGFKDGKIKLPTALVQAQKVDKLLTSLTLPVSDIEHFDDLPVPFRAVAADIQTGEIAVLESGSLAKAIRASMAIPAIMAPVNWDGQMLVDGGIASNLPIEVVRQMGADIVIAVDISTPLKSDDVAESVLSITGQLTGLLVQRNVARELRTLTDSDVLIRPELGDIGSGEFHRVDEAVPTGEVAAEDSLDELQALRLDAQSYASYVSARPVPSSDQLIIEFIEFDNDSRLSDDYLLGRLKVRELPLTFDQKKLDRAIDEMYGLDVFATVSYEVVQRDGKHGLKIDANAKSWGPDYLQFGMKWNTSFNGEGTFNVSAALLKTTINSWNAEWRTGVSIGDEPGIITDFYQPLGRQSNWFVGASAILQRFNVNRFDPVTADISEQLRIDRFGGSVYGGREFGTWGRAIATYTRGRGNREVRIGNPTLPEEDFDIGEVEFTLEADELDNLFFPTRGYLARGTYRVARDGLGATTEFDQALFTLGFAGTRGANTMMLAGDFRTTTSGVAPPERRFRAGGLFSLSGFDFNQLSGQHYGRLMAMYRRSVLDIGIAEVSPGFSLEYGNVWEDKDDIDIGDGIFAGSLFLGADTPLGPVYVAYGLAEGGFDSFYIYIGAIRNSPNLR